MSGLVGLTTKDWLKARKYKSILFKTQKIVKKINQRQFDKVFDKVQTKEWAYLQHFNLYPTPKIPPRQECKNLQDLQSLFSSNFPLSLFHSSSCGHHSPSAVGFLILLPRKKKKHGDIQTRETNAHTGELPWPSPRERATAIFSLQLCKANKNGLAIGVPTFFPTYAKSCRRAHSLSRLILPHNHKDGWRRVTQNERWSTRMVTSHMAAALTPISL